MRTEASDSQTASIYAKSSDKQQPQLRIFRNFPSPPTATGGFFSHPPHEDSISTTATCPTFGCCSHFVQWWPQLVNTVVSWKVRRQKEGGGHPVPFILVCTPPQSPREGPRGRGLQELRAHWLCPECIIGTPLFLKAARWGLRLQSLLLLQPHLVCLRALLGQRRS